jgi:hypothetical protein
MKITNYKRRRGGTLNQLIGNWDGMWKSSYGKLVVDFSQTMQPFQFTKYK